MTQPRLLKVGLLWTILALRGCFLDLILKQIQRYQYASADLINNKCLRWRREIICAQIAQGHMWYLCETRRGAASDQDSGGAARKCEKGVNVTTLQTHQPHYPQNKLHLRSSQGRVRSTISLPLCSSAAPHFILRRRRDFEGPVRTSLLIVASKYMIYTTASGEQLTRSQLPKIPNGVKQWS